MNNLTFKQLRYFDALARHAHFGRAAEACAISQPALSLQIKELELMFGTPLVERGPRKVRLTAVGAQLLLQARQILREVDALGALVRAPGGPLSGLVRMGVIPTIAPYLLPDLVAGMTRSFPQVVLELRESVTGSLIADLAEARLDLAVVALPISEPHLREMALFDEDFVLVRPLSDAGKPVPQAHLLQTMRLLLLEEGHCFRDQALSFCAPGSGQPRQVMEGSSLSTLVQMVGAGLGVTLIPEIAIPLEQRGGAVELVRFPAPAPKRQIGLVWRNANPLASQFADIAALIRTAGESRRDDSRRSCPMPATT